MIAAGSADEPVLVADLDGTVIATDLLHECFLSAFRRAPWVAVACAFWLLRGRAWLKERLASRSCLDVASLPYREEVVAFLRQERSRGRRVVLATASWHGLAEPLARHLGVFDEVLATTREVNLKGEAKAERLVARFGEGGFDYIGDSRADLAVWKRARHAYLAGGGTGMRGALPPEISVKEIPGAVPEASALRAAVRAMRVHQWAKNLLLLVPLLAAHRAGDASSVWLSVQGFTAFCLFASSAYFLNDLLDVEADRAHPRKRLRPLASGHLSIPAGFGLGIGMLVAGAAVAARLPALFQATLAAYFALTLAYSFGLKRVAMLDVISLAALYTIRIIAGGFAIGAPVSFWLLAFAMFLFFSLALVKRYAELIALEDDGIRGAPGRGYAGHDAEIVLAIGSASAMVSALVLALYINGETAKNLYSRPALLWILCPVLLYWVSRIWLLAARGQMHDDPVLFAVRDRVSYFVAAAGAAVVWMAT